MRQYILDIPSYTAEIIIKKKNKKKNFSNINTLISIELKHRRRVIIPVIVGADRFDDAKTSLNNNRASSELVRGNNPGHSQETYIDTFRRQG